jgi:hypothetical protein
MDELFSTQTQPKTVADYKAAIAQLIAEMSRLNHSMQSDRAEIERLKVETRDIQAETRAILTSLGFMR